MPVLHAVAYQQFRPWLETPPLEARAGHVLVGRVTLGAESWLGAGSVIRADGHDVKAGRQFHLGRAATLHIAHETQPTLIGHGVCVGANAVVHACTVGDGCVVEEGVVILDGAVVGASTVIEAGSIVFPRAVLVGSWLYAGRPAKAVRPLEPGEAEARSRSLRARNAADDASWPCHPVASHPAADSFVADTAQISGTVQMAAGSSIWFGCRLDASRGPVTLGPRCNVQDNSVLVAGTAGLTLGEDTTVGHNVTLEDCQVGDRCLVGMGSRIASGTVIAHDCFVAAGCVTEPGQALDSGWVWGGQPARKLGPLDDGKRRAIERTASVYAGYARAMRG